MTQETSQVIRNAPTTALRMPIFASASWPPSNARVAISRATVNPTPAMVPPAAVGAPADGRAQPAAAEPGRQPGRADDAERLAQDVAEEDAEGDRRGERAGQFAAAELDAGVGEGEQRHNHIAGPRVVEALQPLVGGQGRREAPAATDRSSSGVGCSRKSRNRPLARSSAARLAGYAKVSSPMARPITTGSTPDSSSATQTAPARSDVHPAAPGAGGPYQQDQRRTGRVPPAGRERRCLRCRRQR